MENLTIYNVYVEMESQEQCNRMKKLCIDNGLPYWNHKLGFEFDKFRFNEFSFAQFHKEFYIGLDEVYDVNKTKVTEEQFIELLKNK